MKKLFILILIAAIPYVSSAQDATGSSCDKSSCGPGGTKKGEAKVITTLRSDLQSVVSKMSKSSVAFDKEVSEMKIEQGTSDDESLLFISQAINSIRYEFTSKVDQSKLIGSLRDYKPRSFSNKQQMVSALKKEVDMLADQAEKL